MAGVLFLVLLLEYSLLNCVNSAAFQASERLETTSVPDIDTVATAEDIYMVNTTNHNGSKTIASVNGVQSNENVQKVMAVNYDVVATGDITGQDSKNTRVIDAVIEDVRKTDAKSKVMALTDDVITDALFTNIDTIQDHLEICEEGLRQQLRLHSHGSFLRDVAVEEVQYTPNRSGAENNKEDNDESSDVKTNTERNDDDDEDSETEDDESQDEEDDNDDDDIASSKMVVLNSNSKLDKEKTRARRSVKEVFHGGQSSRKADILAQKVVGRLSARLEYLRSSLAQCHLLYRQFGVL